MFMLCLVLLIPPEEPSFDLSSSFKSSLFSGPTKISLPTGLAARKKDRKPPMKYDFSSFTFGHDSAAMTSKSDVSLKKKIDEATKPLEQVIQNLTATNIQLEAQLKNVQEVNFQKASQEQKCLASVKQVKSLTADLSKTKEKVNSLKTELRSSEEKLKTKRWEKLELKTQLDKTAEQLEKVNKTLRKEKAHSSMMSSMSKRMAGMIKKLSAAEKEIKKLRREKLEMKTKLAKRTEQLKNLSKEIKPSIVDGCPEEFTNDIKAELCYGIIKQHANYDAAQLYCKNKYGGRLAVLDTVAKFEAVNMTP